MKHTDKISSRTVMLRHLFGLLMVMGLLCGTAKAQTPAEAPVNLNRETILAAIENSVAVETQNLTELKRRVTYQETLKKAVLVEINAYNIQNIVHNNLLLQPETTLATLEKARIDNQQALSTILSKINGLVETRDADYTLLQQTLVQITLNTDQAQNIENSALTIGEKNAVQLLLKQRDQILTTKKDTLQKLGTGLDLIIQQLQAVETSTAQLQEKITTRIDTRQTEVLFGRKPILTKLLKKGVVTGEVTLLTEHLSKPFQSKHLTTNNRSLRETIAVPLLLVLFLSTVVLFLVLQLRRFLNDYEKKHPDIETHRWRLLFVKLLRRSLVILSGLFVLYGYDLFRFSLAPFSLHLPIASFLLIILFARWVIDYLNYRQPGATFIIPSEMTRAIKTLTIALSFGAFIYMIAYWALGEESALLFAARLLLEIFLLFSCIAFWRTLRIANQTDIENHPIPRSFTYNFLMGVTYLITLGGLVIELSGYPALSFYWFLSWARSLAVLFWAIILFNVIAEWRGDYLSSTTFLKADPDTKKYPFRRAFISSSGLLLLTGTILGLIMAWSTQPTVPDGIYRALSQTIAVGKIGLNLVDVFFAGLILYLTLILTRLGRYYLSDKILAKSNLEPGLQGSVTAIAVYVFWGLSILLALSVLGIGTTSMAVVFGALSVGLGFGLQNIFNNFISGIILLFERPIQVGDNVEINGTWAMVKKINVRATVVDTLDNASLIIPNSEFISSTVKNWSFKNKKLRREIVVGVAYGSDVELVRTTLLEIADKTPKVFKYPNPDVVFDDFGDSALIFRLRIWTDIDNMIIVPTNIRFEIDRIFRDHGIEIAFPQQDLHIRSIDDDAKNQLSQKRQGDRNDVP